MGAEEMVVSLTLAFVLDMWLGDPLWLPHPIRWMGKAIEWAEPRFRLLPFSRVTTGALMSLSLIVLAWAVSMALVSGAMVVHPVLGLLMQTILLFTCISARGLYDAAMTVFHALKQWGLTEGRKAVSMIVGRQVDHLDERGISRATVETVAENLVDGVVSPLFFFVIGGAPLAMAFKMINTLDSMIGYKNDRYLSFGKFAARVDDFANYLPARLTVPLIALASKWLCGRGKQSLTTAIRDGRKHASPNAGYPEAAFAGALSLWLGGPNIYHGRLVQKPVIGEGLSQTRPAQIVRACQLMLASAALAFMTAALSLLLCSVVR